MSTGLFNKQYFYETVEVILDGSGAGTKVVTFQTAFKTIPVVLLIPLAGSPATLSYGGTLTKTGFTLSVTGEANLPSQTAVYAYFAHEKL